jgi:holo-[acyl-carrier protein] synthase
MLPSGHEARIELSMTDEGPMAQAIVIIQAIPVPNPADSR